MMQETNTSTRKKLELADVRDRLSGEEGQQYWRSLDELAQTDAFAELVHREFPEQADELKDPVSRRNFLKVMGASFALGGLSGCTIQPQEKIVPQVRAPEEIVPGKPLFYATAHIEHGIGTGILVESHMGRPTKIEGNPQHPASHGGTSGATQASILDLYDPDRSQTVKNAGRLSTWSTFLDSFMHQLGLQGVKEGAGLRILTQTVTSPTQGALLAEIKKQYPLSQWHQYESVNRDAYNAGTLAAFGQYANSVYDFAKAKVVLSIDADFANSGPASARYARDFAANRRVRDGQKTMNRLYMAESTPSATGSLADHRWSMGTGAMENLVLQIATALGVSTNAQPTGAPSAATNALIKDLQANRGQSIVTAGQDMSAGVHALVHAINEKLGNLGQTVHLTAPLEVDPSSQRASIGALVQDMNDGRVDLLVILGGNPVYDTPADLGFTAAMEKVAARVHMGLAENETSDQCHWHVPEAHYLEAWGDVRAFNGLVSIVQPLIQPLYKAHSAYDLLAVMAGKAGSTALELVREHWESQGISVNFATYWRRALHDGILPGTESPSVTANIRNAIQLDGPFAQLPEEDVLELQLRPDPMVGDGSKANNGWLQETPRPITKLTWDNAALVSPKTAERLRLQNERLAELRLGDSALNVPVWIVPGQADDVITLHFGYGRERGGRVADGCGFNAYQLSTTQFPTGTTGLQISGSYDRYPLACTQEHHSMEGRSLMGKHRWNTTKAIRTLSTKAGMHTTRPKT